MAYIEGFLELLGLEEGDRFKLYDNDNKLYSTYAYVIKNGTMEHEFCGTPVHSCLGDIVNGKVIIKKQPWKPENGEKYYFIGINGMIGDNVFLHSDVNDLAFYNMGNCFKTETAAQAAQPEILKKFKAIQAELSESGGE